MKVSALFSYVAFGILSHSSLQADPSKLLSDLVDSPAPWELSPAEAQAHFQEMGFRWTSADGSQAILRSEELSLWDEKISGVVFTFEEQKLTQIDVAIYDREADGDLDHAEFASRLEGFRKRIGGPSPASLRQRQERPEPAGEAMQWSGAGNRYQLDHRDRRSEKERSYIRLKVEQPKAVPTPLPSSSSRQVGFGYISLSGIPMVRQATTSYCVAAAMEMVFRYHGVKTNQFEMAKLLGTRANGGTDLYTMIDRLKQIDGPMGMRYSEVVGLSMPRMQRLVNHYNAQARRLGVKQVSLKAAGYRLKTLYEMMDARALKAAGGTDPSSRTMLQRVRNQIDQGNPLLWSIHLGVIDEQSRGSRAGQGAPMRVINNRDLRDGSPVIGHMRLITGYNLSTNEIVFSDPWGSSHASKSMPLDAAYAITQGIYCMSPAS
ncbi:MAG: C39 family peptidase [Verrucomicrobiota bacterium]